MTQEQKIIESMFKANCEFVIGAVKVADIPLLKLAEFAFVGRSNVGKSSLINSLINRNSLARVSQNPGCTRQINFYNLANIIHLVDLPGYGFAKVSKGEKQGWQRLIHDYLRGRQQLKRAFILIDSRHEIKESDIKIMTYLDDYALNYQLILTKVDKPTDTDLESNLTTLNKLIAKHPACHPTILVTSSKTKQGINSLREEIFNLREY